MTSASDRHLLDDRVRVAMTLVVVVVTVTLPPWWSYGVVATTLAIVLAASGISIQQYLKRYASVMPLVLFIGVLVPFSVPGEPILVVWERAGWIVTDAGLTRWALVTTRAFLALGWLVHMSCSLSPERIISALHGLRVPRTLVTITWLTYRYLWVLLDETRRLIGAWKARRIVSHQRDNLRILIGIAGVLFMRAIERAERVHIAMQERGFTGEFAVVSFERLNGRNMAFTVSVSVLLVGLSVLAHTLA
jgi:cobalt/nickel transport system permease protein